MKKDNPTVVDNIEMHILTKTPGVKLHWGLNYNQDPTWFGPTAPFPLESERNGESAIQSRFLEDIGTLGAGLYCVQIKIYQPDRYESVDKRITGMSFVILNGSDWHQGPDGKDLRLFF